MRETIDRQLSLSANIYVVRPLVPDNLLFYESVCCMGFRLLFKYLEWLGIAVYDLVQLLSQQKHFLRKNQQVSYSKLLLCWLAGILFQLLS